MALLSLIFSCQVYKNYTVLLVRREKKTPKLSRLDENICAVDVELTSEDLREIDSAASKITIQGARYPEAFEKRTGL